MASSLNPDMAGWDYPTAKNGEQVLLAVHTERCAPDASKVVKEAKAHGLDARPVQMGAGLHESMDRDWRRGEFENAIVVLVVGPCVRSTNVEMYAELANKMAHGGIPVMVFMRTSVDPALPHVRRAVRARFQAAARSSREKRASLVAGGATGVPPAMAVADYRGEHALLVGVQLFLKKLGYERDFETYDDKRRVMTFSHTFQRADENGILADVVEAAAEAGLDIDTLHCWAGRNPITVDFSGTFGPDVTPERAQRFAKECEERFSSAGPLLFLGPSKDSRRGYFEKEKNALMELSARGIRSMPGRLAKLLRTIQRFDANFARVSVTERFVDRERRLKRCKDSLIYVDASNLHDDEERLEELLVEVLAIEGYKGFLRGKPSKGAGQRVEAELLMKHGLMPRPPGRRKSA